jgi:hypothetical protein
VSVPLFLENMSRAEVFPGAVAAYTWNADARRYDALGALDEVEPWRAYWVAANAETPVSHTGLALTEYVRDLAQGWHMLGSIDGGSPSIAALTSAPPGGVSGSAYTWNPGSGYGEASTLDEGAGYWVEIAAACRLDVNQSAP